MEMENIISTFPELSEWLHYEVPRQFLYHDIYSSQGNSLTGVFHSGSKMLQFDLAVLVPVFYSML